MYSRRDSDSSFFRDDGRRYFVTRRQQRGFVECFIYTSIGVPGNMEKNKKNIPQLDLGNGERSYKFCHLT
jgi:hypothetical protein